MKVQLYFGGIARELLILRYSDAVKPNTVSNPQDLTWKFGKMHGLTNWKGIVLYHDTQRGIDKLVVRYETLV